MKTSRIILWLAAVSVVIVCVFALSRNRERVSGPVPAAISASPTVQVNDDPCVARPGLGGCAKGA